MISSTRRQFLTSLTASGLFLATDKFFLIPGLDRGGQIYTPENLRYFNEDKARLIWYGNPTNSRLFNARYYQQISEVIEWPF